MASYCPRPQLRDQCVVPSTSALLVVDLQYYNADKEGAIAQACSTQDVEGADRAYFFSRLESMVLPNCQRLLAACRAAGVEVIYTVIQSLTRDGRDRGLDYRISGFQVPPGSRDAQVLDCIAPQADEMVLPKTTSSVFSSTTLDHVLRAMGRTSLVVVGAVTDQCIAHAVMDACDKGYFVTLVPGVPLQDQLGGRPAPNTLQEDHQDCCATYSQDRHDASLRAVSGYCRQRSTDQLVQELLGVAVAAAAACTGGNVQLDV